MASAHVQVMVLHVRACVCVCVLVCTSGLATADDTERDPVPRECEDDPLLLVLLEVLDKTVLCRQQQEVDNY